MKDLSKFNKKTWIIGSLRRISGRYPFKYLTKAEARIERGLYTCAICKQPTRSKNIQVDHIVPVVGSEGFVDWDTFIERLFCEKEGFQAVCKCCHSDKTKSENAERKRIRSLTKVPKKRKLKG